jgi:hypothetical protein
MNTDMMYYALKAYWDNGEQPMPALLASSRSAVNVDLYVVHRHVALQRLKGSSAKNDLQRTKVSRWIQF